MIKHGGQQKQYGRAELYKKVKFLGADGKVKLALMAVSSNDNDDTSGKMLKKNNIIQEFCLKADLVNNINIENYNCKTQKDFSFRNNTKG